jgi:hypothetical protein
MTERPPILERAFQLVENDACRSVVAVRAWLSAEGYTYAELGQLTTSVVTQLKALLAKRGSLFK